MRPSDLIKEAQLFLTMEHELREDLRHALSAILMDTSEENPLETDIVIGENSYCGSTLDLPRIISCWQHPTEGWIYFQIEGAGVPTDFDDMLTVDLIHIYEELMP